MGGLIVYECVAAKHQSADGTPDKLTVHERAWAFCPCGAQAEGHEWKATGGLDLNVLLHRGGRSIVKSVEAPAKA